MTDYERGFEAGREAAAKVAESAECSCPSGIQQIAARIRSLPPAPERFEEWHARECPWRSYRTLRDPGCSGGVRFRGPDGTRWTDRTCREVYAAEHPPQAEQAAGEGEKPPERNLDRRAFEALVASCCNPVPIASTDKGRRVRIEFLAAPIEDALRQAFREGEIAGLHAKSEARGAEVLNEKVPGASRTPELLLGGDSPPSPEERVTPPTGTTPLPSAAGRLADALALSVESAMEYLLAHRRKDESVGAGTVWTVYNTLEGALAAAKEGGGGTVALDGDTRRECPTCKQDVPWGVPLPEGATPEERALAEAVIRAAEDVDTIHYLGDGNDPASFRMLHTTLAKYCAFLEAQRCARGDSNQEKNP